MQPANFAPRVKIPVLMVNGKDDFAVSLAEQRRFFELLGTPAHLKKLWSSRADMCRRTRASSSAKC